MLQGKGTPDKLLEAGRFSKGSVPAGEHTAAVAPLIPPAVLDGKRSEKHLCKQACCRQPTEQTRQQEGIAPSLLIVFLTDPCRPDMTVVYNLQSPTAKGEGARASGINNDASTITRQWRGNLSRNTHFLS